MLVLIVEDHQELSLLLTMVAEEFLGYTSHIVDSARDAISFDGTPNIVLTDWGLTDGQSAGLQVVQHFAPRVPVIVISGTLANKAPALAAGASAFVAKPFDLEELSQTIQAIVQSQDPSP